MFCCSKLHMQQNQKCELKWSKQMKSDSQTSSQEWAGSVSVSNRPTPGSGASTPASSTSTPGQSTTTASGSEELRRIFERSIQQISPTSTSSAAGSPAPLSVRQEIEEVLNEGSRKGRLYQITGLGKRVLEILNRE